jgi:hypothetical protein
MTTIELVSTILCLIIVIFNTYMAATTTTKLPQVRIILWCAVLLPALAVASQLFLVYVRT